MVLLHGGPGGTHHYFHPTFSRAAEFSRVIYYDQRGCGLSDYAPGEGYTIQQAADDIEALRLVMLPQKQGAQLRIFQAADAGFHIR